MPPVCSFPHTQNRIPKGRPRRPVPLTNLSLSPWGRLNVGMWLPCLLRTRPSTSLRKTGAGSLGTEAWDASIFCSPWTNVETRKHPSGWCI